MLWWFNQNLPHSKPDSSHELMILETDVMRFMAILGFCLMAIFALVQSLPVGQSDARPKLEDALQLAQEVETLQQQVREARDRLTELEIRLVATRKAKRQAQADNIKAQRELKQTVDQVKRFELTRDQLKRGALETEKELNAISQSLDEIQATLTEREQQLSSLDRQILARQDTLVMLRRKLEVQRQELARIEAKFTSTGLAVSRLQDKEHAKDGHQQKLNQKPFPKPSRKGFSLHFASDGVLSTLVKNNRVQLFAMLRSRAWQLTFQSDSPRFMSSALPSSFYEMHAHTVPRELLVTIRRTAAIFDVKRLTWGTTLPEETRKEIQKLMVRHDGGDLVIQADGKVKMMP